jgi:hypothetical protein
VQYLESVFALVFRTADLPNVVPPADIGPSQVWLNARVGVDPVASGCGWLLEYIAPIHDMSPQ